MKLFEKIKLLLASKISVTIITPPPDGVHYSTRPKDVSELPPIIRRNHTNLRFVEERKTDAFGNENRIVYFTEEYAGGKWSCVIDSIACDKDKALLLHMRLAENKPLKETNVKQVLWEGLTKEETETWIGIQRDLTKKDS